MGNISRDTFDKLKHYVSVRLQQGVPLVDADWNEDDDIRKYELEAFLKWFVGDGVPLGNNGFQIVALAGAPNDFTIRGGDGTTDGAGRCLVEGWDVINESDINYSAQVLTDSAKATALGVPAIELTWFTVDGDYTAYLDIWEREVLPGEIGDDPFVYDRNLVNEDIGLPTCTRLKREWVVRVVLGTTVPVASAGHIHYPLARIARRASDTNIDPENITDLRRVGLKVGSYYDTQQIVGDAFGTSYTLDGDGTPNLKISLRDAINALLKGGIPATPPFQLTLHPAVDINQFAVVDSAGDVWVFWQSNRSGNVDIWSKRYRRAIATWDADVPLTTDASDDRKPVALLDTAGDIWVFWTSARSGNNDIWHKRYNSATATWGADMALTTDASDDDNPVALVDTIGDIWVFWTSHRSGNNDIWSKRYVRATATWDADIALTTDAGDDRNPVARIDSAGDIWVFWQSNRSGTFDIRLKRYRHAILTWETDEPLSIDAGTDAEPFAVVDDTGEIWVFWTSDRIGNNDIWYKRYNPAIATWYNDTNLTPDNDDDDNSPRAVVDTAGDIWAFWTSDRRGNDTILYKRHSRTGGWSDGRPLTTHDAATESDSHAVIDADGDIWVFWTSDRSGDNNIWQCKLIPQI